MLKDDNSTWDYNLHINFQIINCLLRKNRDMMKVLEIKVVNNEKA